MRQKNAIATVAAIPALALLGLAACGPSNKGYDPVRTQNPASEPVKAADGDLMINTWGCSTDLSDGPLTFTITSESILSPGGLLHANYMITQSDENGKTVGRIGAMGVWSHDGDTYSETIDNIQIDDLFIDDFRAQKEAHSSFLDRYSKMLLGTRDFHIENLQADWLAMTSDRGATHCA
ncbi:MAG: hypothetical protein KDA53_00040 [Hyphomonas sp.]|nr:hypothetical protein [Hyphomonas sp.]